MKAYNIQWDTDGEDIKSLGLPTEVIIPKHIAATHDEAELIIED